MNKAERDRILARKSRREESLLKRVKPKHRRAAATPSGAAGSAAGTTSSPLTAKQDAPAPPLDSIVAQYVEEYTAAQMEIARQRERLVALRDGEENLTEEDHEALENIRDIVSARYERLLEV